MAGVPFVFATQTGPIPLSQLDSNFSSLTGASGSSLVQFTSSGAGAVSRPVQSKLGDYVNVVDFGADPTGAVDSTSAFQSAINYANSIGRDVEFEGIFSLSSPGISINNGSDATFSGFRCSLFGRGYRQSILNFGAGNYTCISITGSNTNNGALSGQKVENFILSKSDNLGNCVSCIQASHMIFSNVRTNGGNIGWNLVDMQESTFLNCMGTFANGGILAAPGTFTSPNALSFVGCTFGNNNNYGGDFQNCAAISFNGCTFESNNNSSIGGTAATWGVRLIFNNDASQQGTSGAVFNSCYFENNGLNSSSVTNTGDVWIVNSASQMAVSLIGCSFQRHSFFTTNCVRVETSGGHHTWINSYGCGFRGYSDYTASSSRPYILLTNPSDTVRITALGNEYQNATEAPVFTNQDNISPEFIPNAWVRFNGATAAIQSSANVATVSRSSTGVYVITFSQPMLNSANFSYGLALVGGAGFIGVTAESSASVTVNTFNTAATATDFQVSLQVYGGGRMT